MLSNHEISGTFDVYYRIFRYLIDEFECRISGMNSFLPLMKMFANPMSVDARTAPDNFPWKLLDIKSDFKLRRAF